MTPFHNLTIGDLAWFVFLGTAASAGITWFFGALDLLFPPKRRTR